MSYWRRLGNLHVIFPVILFVVMVVLIFVAAGYPPKPRQLPLVIVILTAVLCLVQIIVEIRKTVPNTDNGQTDGTEPNENAEEKRRIRSQLLGCFLAMPVFFLINYLFGFLAASVVFIGGLSWFLGFRRKIALLIWAIGFPVVNYVLFSYFLRISFPAGIVWGWFHA